MFKLRKIEVQRDLVVINFLTLILVLVASLTSFAWLRTIFGLPILLFFPGYILIAALFPRKETLDGIERLALSFGLSIAIVPIIGIILNYVYRIEIYAVVISLGVFIIVMSAFTWYRRMKYPSDDRFTVPFLYRKNLPRLNWHGARKLDKALYIILAISILGSIGTVVYTIAVPKVGERFTEFYILDTDGKTENYPHELAVGAMGAITLHIVNYEHETVSYRVEVWIEEEQTNVWLDGKELEEIVLVPLNHREKWEYQIGFASSEACGSTTLSASVAKGETILTVAGIDAFEVGDYIQIGSSDVDDEDKKVEAFQIEEIDPADSSITINKELTYDHIAEEPVVENHKVEFRLFKDGETESYLTTHLYVHFSAA